MANEDHIAMLEQGVEAWNQWREEHSDELDLSGANFIDENFRGVNFRGVNLREADLRWADLREADLGGANLVLANLSSTNFRMADLTGANLTGASLSLTNFGDSNLYGADFRQAFLGETIFGNTNLKYAKGLDTCNHRSGSTIDHRTLEISGSLPTNFLQGCGLPQLLIDYLPTLLNQPIQFYSCFISYSHADQVFARRLHDQLQGRGIRCWLDEHQLLPGDDIYDQVDRGIRLWDKTLLCCSESSLTSWWVDNETNTAFEKEQKLMRDRGKKILALIPLNLDGYLFSDKWESGKASQVKSRMAADFTGWEHDNDKFETAFELVVKALTTDDRSRELVPESKL